jgi:iron complex transport system permease protein
MVVTAMFNAGVSITKNLADADTQLGEITFWLMGSMTHLTLASLPILLIPVAIGLVPIILLRYRLNVLSFGEEEARTLGLNVRALRAVLIVSSTLVTSAATATCGIVGWIGLVIPHLLRMVVGPDYRMLIPASITGGALFLLLVDNITRIFFQVEISIGILTALIGAPFFLVLLMRGKKGWV